MISRPAFRGAFALFAALLLLPSGSAADAGLLRLSEQSGPYRISVFSDPTPLRSDTASLDILVSRRSDGRPLRPAEVWVTIDFAGAAGPAPTQRFRATRRPGGLVYEVTLPEAPAGPVKFTIEVTGATGTATVGFVAEVAKAEAFWRREALALSVPPVGIALFALHQHLARRMGRRRQQ